MASHLARSRKSKKKVRVRYMNKQKWFDSLGFGAPERLVFLRQTHEGQLTTVSSSDGSAGSHFLAGGKAGSSGKLGVFCFQFSRS